MNTKQYTPNTSSYAFQLGINSAKAGEPCVPECIFVSRRQQVNFAAGYELISGPTFATVQFTGSEMPAPVVAVAPVVNERTRKTDNATYARIVALTEKRQKRVEALIADALTFCPTFVVTDCAAV